VTFFLLMDFLDDVFVFLNDFLDDLFGDVF
jgi:hypothetical protein